MPYKPARWAPDTKVDVGRVDKIFAPSVQRRLLDAFPQHRIIVSGVGRAKQVARTVTIDGEKVLEVVFPHTDIPLKSGPPVGRGFFMGRALQAGHHISNIIGRKIDIVRPFRQLQEQGITTTTVQPKIFVLGTADAPRLADKTGSAVLAVLPVPGRLKDRLKYVEGARAFADHLKGEKAEKAHELIDELIGIWADPVPAFGGTIAKGIAPTAAGPGTAAIRGAAPDLSLIHI